MCPNVVCVLTKIDFYPAWRKIRDLNVEHLKRAGIPSEQLCVSSSLRVHALRTNDRELNRESGFPAGRLPAEQDRGQRREAQRRSAASDVLAVAAMLESQFASERQALNDPEQARDMVSNLTELKARAERLRSGVSKWQQTLSDGITDLQADVDHDLRGRLRQVTRQADEALEASDPAETWDEFQAWLYRRVAEDVVHNYTLHTRAQALTARVSEHFGEDGVDIVVDLDVANPTEVLTSVDANTDIDLTRWASAARAWPPCGAATAACSCSACWAAWPAWPWPTPPPSSSACSWAARRCGARRSASSPCAATRPARRTASTPTRWASWWARTRATRCAGCSGMRDFFAARAEELHRPPARRWPPPSRRSSPTPPPGPSACATSTPS